MSLFKKLFGDYSTKEIKRINGIKEKVLALDGEYSALTDEQLQAKTPEFKERLEKGETLDDILPEAFAACREAAWRVLGTLLTAVSVSVSGSISWIGLAMPHIARLLCGNDNRFTLPCTMLCGSIFMVVVDVLCRCISVNEIPVSIMTGILGAVIYISVLIKKGKDIR